MQDSYQTEKLNEAILPDQCYIDFTNNSVLL